MVIVTDARDSQTVEHVVARNTMPTASRPKFFPSNRLSCYRPLCGVTVRPTDYIDIEAVVSYAIADARAAL